MTLVENNIKTLDDLADLDSEELYTLLGKVFNNENEAGEVIMEARKHWFEEDKIKEKLKMSENNSKERKN